MKIRYIATVSLLLLSFSASAEFRTITRAIEVSLSNLQVPAAPNGSLIFRECADCESRLIPMARNTIFQLNGKSLSLKDLREAVHNVQDREAVTIVVMHHLESNTVTAINANI